MRIAVGGVRRLVAHAICDGYCAEPYVNERRDVAVPQVVDAYPLYAGKSATALHLSPEIRFDHTLEDPLVALDLESLFDIEPHLLGQEVRYGDCAD